MYTEGNTRSSPEIHRVRFLHQQGVPGCNHCARYPVIGAYTTSSTIVRQTPVVKITWPYEQVFIMLFTVEIPTLFVASGRINLDNGGL